MRAREIIEEARDYDPSFNRRATPDPVALRRLSRIEVVVATMVAELEPEALNSLHTIELAVITAALGEDGDGSLAVPAYVTPIRIRAIDEDGFSREVVWINRRQQLQRGAPFPSVALSDAALHLTDARLVGADIHGWEEIDHINFEHVPVPPPLTTLNQELTLPDALGGALTSELAGWMAGRLNLGARAAELRGEAEAARSVFLSTVAQQGMGGNWHVLDRSP